MTVKILDTNSPDFITEFTDATGIEPGDTLHITTPQFERGDGRVPCDGLEVNYSGLHNLRHNDLIQIGCRVWDESGLYLFPYQWYDTIPEGFEMMCINGKPERFERGVTDDDYRMGVLAYGIIPDFRKS